MTSSDDICNEGIKINSPPLEDKGNGRKSLVESSKDEDYKKTQIYLLPDEHNDDEQTNINSSLSKDKGFEKIDNIEISNGEDETSVIFSPSISSPDQETYVSRLRSFCGLNSLNLDCIFNTIGAISFIAGFICVIGMLYFYEPSPENDKTMIIIIISFAFCALCFVGIKIYEECN